jgi:hypothetical protein
MLGNFHCVSAINSSNAQNSDSNVSQTLADLIKLIIMPAILNLNTKSKFDWEKICNEIEVLQILIDKGIESDFFKLNVLIGATDLLINFRKLDEQSKHANFRNLPSSFAELPRNVIERFITHHALEEDVFSEPAAFPFYSYACEFLKKFNQESKFHQEFIGFLKQMLHSNQYSIRINILLLYPK